MAEMNDVPKTMKRPPMPQKGLLPLTVLKKEVPTNG